MAGSGLAAALAGLLAAGCGQQPSGGAPDAAAATLRAAAPGPALVPLTNMVAIKAGSFLRQQHTVTLTRDYWIGRYEVTQAEYADVTGKNPSHFKGDTARPVEKLSFFDAAAYCGAVSARERVAGRLPAPYEYRLPTEAEWEYACRAGSTNFYSFGDKSDADSYCWSLDNSDGTTHPVGQKKPNAWGLYDMHGNVWEWCQDWFGMNPAADVVDPVGPTQSKYKVFRGGSWNHDIDMARAQNRFMMSPSNGIHFVGFRLVLGQPLPPPTAKAIEPPMNPGGPRPK